MIEYKMVRLDVYLPCGKLWRKTCEARALKMTFRPARARGMAVYFTEN
jgi:hypothetical protein